MRSIQLEHVRVVMRPNHDALHTSRSCPSSPFVPLPQLVGSILCEIPRRGRGMRFSKGGGGFAAPSL